MKVVLVNHSDTRGGASVVTYRLLKALRAEGIDARMLVMHKGTDDPDVVVAAPAFARKFSFIDEQCEILLHNGFNRADMFKASIGACGLPLHRHPLVKEADVVALNWINQGMLSINGIARIDKPLVWTMHDMWNLTGVCHHAGECMGYTNRCGNCRLMHHGTNPNDYSVKVLRSKKRLYHSKDINFVAVSNWLARRCKRSAIMRDQKVEVIPNAFPVEDFYIEPTRSRASLGLPEGKRLIVMGAARLDDPIKGLDIAVEALNRLTDTDAAAVLFGDIRDRSALDGLRLPYVHLGAVNDPETLREIYAHGSVVLSTSHYETLPGTLVEGMAAGCVPVTFGRGGQSDIVDHGRTGIIATYPDSRNISDGIRHALSGDFDPETLRRSVAERFSASQVARKYITLFEKLV